VEGLLQEAGHETGPLSAATRGASLELWQKADAYYFCNIARVQRIWQAS
jgi:hypothetical protein